MFKRIVLASLVVALAGCAQPGGDESATEAAQRAAGESAAQADAAVSQAQAAAGDIDALVAAADPEQGKRFYIFCQACHTLNEGGMNKVGPNLHAIVVCAAILRRDVSGERFVWDQMAPPVGFEPTTNGLTVRCATAAPQGSNFERASYVFWPVWSRLGPTLAGWKCVHEQVTGRLSGARRSTLARPLP